MMSFFANIFGYVLNLLYQLIGNYGLAIILFSILVKVAMLPLTIKQQKTMKKNEKMQAEMKKLQFNYKNDPEKLNQEVMALYKREGMSPFSGCLSSIVQLILLFSVFLLVRSPLTYMVKLDTDVINKMESFISEEGNNNAYKEIAIIQYVKNYKADGDSAKVDSNGNAKSDDSVKENDKNNEKEDAEGKFDINQYREQVDLNMDFFGIDLTQVPTQNLTDWKTLVIPVLYVVSSIASIKLSTAKSKKKEEKLITDGKGENEEKEYNPMDDANKTMLWMMPIMSVSIAIIAPLGLALYWLMNNILMIVERLVLNKILNKEEAK